jgi:ethanolamine utilization protein EutA (predicted chaperonin)
LDQWNLANFVDLGRIIASVEAIPVVVKSLVFEG